MRLYFVEKKSDCCIWLSSTHALCEAIKQINCPGMKGCGFTIFISIGIVAELPDDNLR